MHQLIRDLLQLFQKCSPSRRQQTVCQDYAAGKQKTMSEQKELLEKVKEEEKQLSEMEQKSVDMRLLLQGLRGFTAMQQADPAH